MYVRVLGSAAGGGFPQWNCHCFNCDGFRLGIVNAQARTQSSIAVSDDGHQWILINASPDIAQQISFFPPLSICNNKRGTSIAAVILTDSQFDHCAGLISLREGTPPIYASTTVKEDLDSAFPLLKILTSYGKTVVKEIPLQSNFKIGELSYLDFYALSIDGKNPPYIENQELREGNSLALLINDPRKQKKLLYAPNIPSLGLPLLELMGSADVLLVDGTFWTENEMIEQRLGSKSASRMGHLPLSGKQGLLQALTNFSKARKILIHINNSNPILIEDSHERSLLSSYGIEVAYDGMELSIEAEFATAVATYV